MGQGQQGDQQASNGIVAVVAFYAGALARAHGEIEQRDQAIALLRDEMRHRGDELHTARVEADNLRSSAHRMSQELNELNSGLSSERQLHNDAKRRVNALSNEKCDVETKYTKLLTENERLQRVNVESHNERDGLRKTVHESGEALGWLKSSTKQVVDGLRNAVRKAGFNVNTPEELLAAVNAIAKDYKAPVDVTVEDESSTTPKALPPKHYKKT
jgi:chromosome segregation ATPase